MQSGYSSLSRFSTAAANDQRSEQEEPARVIRSQHLSALFTYHRHNRWVQGDPLGEGAGLDARMWILRSKPATLLLAVITAAAVLNALSLWTITVDDSYISLRYARSFLSGEGLTYNPGERVEGFSNPTWVALMALTLPVSASLMGSKVIGVFSLIATILGCVGLAAELTPPKTRVQELALISGSGFLAVSLPAVFWPVTGMETSFYAAMIVLTAWRLLVEIREPQRSPLSAVLAGLTAITRPEAPLVVGGLLLGRLAAGREDRRSTARWLGIFAVPTVGYLCFRLRNSL